MKKSITTLLAIITLFGCINGNINKPAQETNQQVIEHLDSLYDSGCTLQDMIDLQETIIASPVVDTCCILEGNFYVLYKDGESQLYMF